MTHTPTSAAPRRTVTRPGVTRPGVRMLAIAAAAALALTGCQAASDDADTTETGAAPVSVLLDWSPNPDHVALYTAQHTGAYGDAGVDVTFMTPANTADAAREVSLGRADLAISYEPDTLIAAEQGLDVISVAALIPTSLTSLIARTESGITTAADLEGRTVGLSGLASQQPTLDFIAREAGVDPGSISTPNVQQSLNQALLTDQVDAIFGAFRNIEGVELTAQGDVVVLPATELGVPDYAELVIIANPTRLADDADYAERVRHFLAGTAEGQAAALRDRQVAIDALTPETQGSYDPDILEMMIDATLELLPEDDFGRQSDEDWAAYARWMYQNGLLETEVDGAAATTNDYLPGAGD
ncbi:MULTISPECIES: ABC transporter substrate-binding protein [unclassified Dietzia]|uniref:ABC transporter substrate-binding protein n=1 Tax=unclassified Dietzia TaxID=2617939 RepID=UPI0015F9B376|nr:MULTISPECIES: ABC transporter substrate-binding protein [unclassified Dietzia]MBB1024886.1 ABC transporter substrate-binding protein [Dietzia sp. DQ12-76]MBB1028478.1 ABC transporter substrate-binding protein [Dietzia sp. DQ11-38-2]